MVFLAVSRVYVPAQIDSGMYADWATQLRTMKPADHIFSFTFISLAAGETVASQPRCLRAALGVLRAMPCAPWQVYIAGWFSTDENIRELQNLPHSRHLELALASQAVEGSEQHADWPLARLPHTLPRTFCKVALDGRSLQQGEMRACVLNAPADRTSDQPLNFVLHGAQNSGLVAGLKATMERKDMYPHVSVQLDPGHMKQAEEQMRQIDLYE